VNRSLVYRLARRLGEPDLAPVHRLDRDTAGLVLLARQASDRAAFHRLFAGGAVEKVYRAVSEGPVPEQRYWRVRSRIVPAERPFRRVSIPDPEGDAVTDVYLDGARDGRLGFLIRPETGRQHQIRLHLCQIGFPILGDRRYPQLRAPLPEGEELRDPLQLLAQQLGFRDPVTGRRHRFVSNRRLHADPTPA
ncbi:MAG: pseudouridine synthase, partial [Candidatus Eisenbacteria bacterium]|nr:pseudouridine synthase [Candidatus Eisenbacteria bacterium]